MFDAAAFVAICAAFVAGMAAYFAHRSYARILDLEDAIHEHIKDWPPQQPPSDGWYIPDPSCEPVNKP